MPRYGYKREAVLTREEVAGMIERADKPWVKSLIAALYIYGNRIAELLEAKRKDFWMDEQGVLTVHLVIKKRKETGPVVETHHILKAASNAPFFSVLVGYLEGMTDPESEVWPIGRCYNTKYNKVWKEIHTLNPNCSTHLFRHTRLTKLGLIGADAMDLKDWSGRKTIPIEYLHLGGKKAAKFADKLD